MSYSSKNPRASDHNSDSADLEPINNLLNLLLEQNSAKGVGNLNSESAEPEPQQSQDQEVDQVWQSPSFLTKAKEDTAAQNQIEDKNTGLDDVDSDSNKDTNIDDLATSENTDVNLENSDQAISVDGEIEHLSLQKAVEYEAFLRQKVEPSPESIIADQGLEQNSGADLEVMTPVPVDSASLSTTDQSENSSEVANARELDIQQESKLRAESPRDVVETVNTLIPLIVELLKYRIEDSQDSIVTAVTPVLDRIIEERSQEDSPKMAAAIAKILPHAITEEINLSPEAIAKAIAPELALCIKEQIRLDEDAISEALGSEMGKAIKSQIEQEKDAMVDALYPVIGSTIAKYMVEVVQDINSKVENTLSLDGIKRKAQAKIQGVSEAELIFRESVGYYVQAVFLIDKDSGVVIQEIKRATDQHLDSDMIAGMLTAIRSFANDCIASGSELDEIDYGDCQIPIEVAGYCYLAVVIKGEPTKEFRTKIRQVLGEIVLKYGEQIADYQGDVSTVPTQVKYMLEELIQDKTESPKTQKSSASTFLWLLAFILGMILIPWGIISHRANVAQAIEQTAIKQLDAAPELSIYRLEPYVNRGVLTISGKVPNKYLQNQAAVITQAVASQNNLKLDNQIIAIKIPPNPSLVAGEVQRLSHSINRQPNKAIQTKYQPETKTLTITGFILNPSDQESIPKIFSQVPGIEKIVLNIDTQLPTIKERIQFNSGSDKLDFVASPSKINAVAKFLKQHSQLGIKLMAYNDDIGSAKANQRLALARCQTVRAALVDKGVDSARIDHCGKSSTPLENNQATWLNRYVSFEPFIRPQSPPKN